MDSDESKILAERTRVRAADRIIKDGYMNGAASGQDSTFQDSFDIAYKQGLSFGIKLGFKDSYNETGNRGNNVNCQICLNNTLQQDMRNLYNIQDASNNIYLK